MSFLYAVFPWIERCKNDQTWAICDLEMGWMYNLLSMNPCHPLILPLHFDPSLLPGSASPGSWSMLCTSWMISCWWSLGHGWLVMQQPLTGYFVGFDDIMAGVMVVYQLVIYVYANKYINIYIYLFIYSCIYLFRFFYWDILWLLGDLMGYPGLNIQKDVENPWVNQKNDLQTVGFPHLC